MHTYMLCLWTLYADRRSPVGCVVVITVSRGWTLYADRRSPVGCVVVITVSRGCTFLCAERIVAETIGSHIIMQRMTSSWCVMMCLLVSVFCETAQALVFLLVSVCGFTVQALVLLLVSVCYEFVVDLSVRWVWRYITGIIVVIVAVVVICYGGLRQALAWCQRRRVVACSCQLHTTVTSRVQYACLLDLQLLFTGGRFPESRRIASAFLRKGRLCGR